MLFLHKNYAECLLFPILQLADYMLSIKHVLFTVFIVMFHVKLFA